MKIKKFVVHGLGATWGSVDLDREYFYKGYNPLKAIFFFLAEKHHNIYENVTIERR